MCDQNTSQLISIDQYKVELIKFINKDICDLCNTALSNIDDKSAKAFLNLFPIISILFSETFIYRDKVKLVTKIGMKWGDKESDDMVEILKQWKEFLINDRIDVFNMCFEMVSKEDESVLILSFMLNFSFKVSGEIIMGYEAYTASPSLIH